MLTLFKVCIVEEERMMSVSQDVRHFTDSKGGTIYHYHLQMHTYIASSGQHIAMKVHTREGPCCCKDHICKHAHPLK